MLTYESKRQDSFLTKLQIFLFTRAFDGHITDYLRKDQDDIKKEFNEFKLDNEIAELYCSQYYQFETNIQICLNGKQFTIKQIVEHLMDRDKYLLSRKNLKTFLGEFHYTLLKDYDFIGENDFKKITENDTCSYCGISKEKISLLGDNAKLRNKRSDTRGYNLEIDRKNPNLEYTKDNCCMSCYWCNNAKTDEFTVAEFKEIAKGINMAWNSRLNEAGLESVSFPENADVFKN